MATYKFSNIASGGTSSLLIADTTANCVSNVEVDITTYDTCDMVNSSIVSYPSEGGLSVSLGINKNEGPARTSLVKLTYMTNSPSIFNPNGQEFIDLGLPSGKLWAKKNIGADSETDAGLYFQWGDTVGYPYVGTSSQHKFDWTTYKFGNALEDPSNLTKYKFIHKDGVTEALDLSDDAARANWGGDWEIPSVGDYQELIDNTYVSSSGNSGVTLVSKYNDEKIVMPSGGYISGTSKINHHHFADYWAKEHRKVTEYRGVYSEYKYSDAMMFQYHTGPKLKTNIDSYRVLGFNIRGIINPSKCTHDIVLEQKSGNNSCPENVTVVNSYIGSAAGTYGNNVYFKKSAFSSVQNAIGCDGTVITRAYWGNGVYSDGSNEIIVEANKNPSPTVRYGSVTVKADSCTYYISVQQDKGECACENAWIIDGYGWEPDPEEPTGFYYTCYIQNNTSSPVVIAAYSFIAGVSDFEEFHNVQTIPANSTSLFANTKLDNDYEGLESVNVSEAKVYVGATEEREVPVSIRPTTGLPRGGSITLIYNG